MFSGKTSHLLRDVTRYADLSNKKCALLINHSLDTRDCNKIISSHSSMYKGLSEKVDVLSSGCLSTVDVTNYSIIGIDEASFFSDLVTTIEQWLKLGKHIVCSGLDGNYKMEQFGDIGKLLNLADKFVKLTAVCTICTKQLIEKGYNINPGNEVPAPFTDRLPECQSENDIDIGGCEKYIAVCRKHHSSKSA